VRKIVVLAVLNAFVLTVSTSAFADSKSAAEFMLKTCLPAMDDLANVEAMARADNWTPKPVSTSPAANRFRSSHSNWGVTKSEETFYVDVWINHVGQQHYNICFVHFLSNNVNREEFIGFITASLELTLISDARLAEIQMRSEQYRIKSDRPNPIQLGIQSQIADGRVTVSSITEMLRFIIPPVLPAAPPQNGQ
jgi:hypothetical protein